MYADNAHGGFLNLLLRKKPNNKSGPSTVAYYILCTIYHIPGNTQDRTNLVSNLHDEFARQTTEREGTNNRPAMLSRYNGMIWTRSSQRKDLDIFPTERSRRHLPIAVIRFRCVCPPFSFGETRLQMFALGGVLRILAIGCVCYLLILLIACRQGGYHTV